MRLTRRSNSANWFVEVQYQGKRYVRSCRTDHKPTARRVAEDLYRQIQLEAVKGPLREISFKKAVDRYYSIRKDSPSAGSLKGTINSVLRIIDGHVLLSQFTRQMFDDFVEHRKREGRKPQTIKHGVKLIAAVIKQAKRDGFYVADVEPPSITVKPTRLRYLSLEEERRLLHELDPKRTGPCMSTVQTRPHHIRHHLQDNYDLVVILLDTGARYGEIARLKWEQVDLEKRTINLWRSKVSNESVLFMTKRVFEVLERRSRTTAKTNTEYYVFGSDNGGPRKNNNIAIRKAFKRAGLHDCTIHTLRHTHATRLIQNGLSIYEVRSVLGHTDIKTTMRYAHLEDLSVTQRARDVIEGMI